MIKSMIGGIVAAAALTMLSFHGDRRTGNR